MKKGRVLAAMSGGVDSSVAAALLHEEGWEVIGVTLRLWEEEIPVSPGADRRCCAVDAVRDARRVADALGIPHYVISAREPFRKRVVGYFIDEYCRGRTPNPCVLCNRELKFAALLQKAQELGAACLATGHYARVDFCPESRRYLLRKGLDPGKDQSYMLFNLTQEQLSRCLFPLGNLRKEEVRRQAAERRLAVADKLDSQEICFVPGDNYREFLQRQGVDISPGPVVNRSGAVLGSHQGIPFYTVGQRRGLGLTSPRPLYVLEIRAEDNTLVVGEKAELASPGMIVGNLNPVAVPDFSETRRAGVKIRYRSPEVSADLDLLPGGETIRVSFDRPQPAVTPGQAAVFYRGDLVLGGGVIQKSENRSQKTEVRRQNEGQA